MTPCPSRCKRLKDVNMFGGFKQCNTCRENRRASHHRNFEKNKHKTNEKAREKRENNSQYCPNCGQNVRLENWEEHFNWFRQRGSELNLLMKDYEKICLVQNYLLKKGNKQNKNIIERRKEYMPN